MSFNGGKRRTLVLCGSDGIAKLVTLQRIVNVGMQKLRLARTKSQFVPHLTLLYDERSIEEQQIERIGWTVTEFVLVHSLLGRGQYDILGRWPLRADGVRLH
jgi:2'-5' RNA ligase